MGLLRTAWLAIKMRFVWLVLTAAVIAGAILIFGHRSRKVDTLRRILADRVLDEVIADIERRVIRHEIRKRLTVLDFAGERGAYIADLLRKRLRRKGILAESRKSALRKAVEAVGLSDTATSAPKAASVADQLGADAAVFGQVEEFSRTDREGALRLQVAVAEAASGRELMRATYARAWPGGLLDVLASVGAGWRLLIWLGLAVVLPFAVYPIARAALERESNPLTFLLLFVMTALDVVAALLLLGFSVRTVWAALLIVAALGAATAYNYLVLNSYEKMRI
jgi:hypothetical protein